MRKTNSGDTFDQLMAMLESSGSSFIEYRVELLRIALAMSLKEAREYAAKTQQQIAEILDVRQPWISKLESCNNDHTFESLARYIFALGADITLGATFGDGVSIELASSKNDGVRKHKAGRLPEFIRPIVPHSISARHGTPPEARQKTGRQKQADRRA